MLSTILLLSFLTKVGQQMQSVFRQKKSDRIAGLIKQLYVLRKACLGCSFFYFFTCINPLFAASLPFKFQWYLALPHSLAYF